MTDPIHDLYSTQHTKTCAWLRACFPRFSHEDAEDAASGAWLRLLERPQMIREVLHRSGISGLRRLHRTIAWRRLNGERRRQLRRPVHSVSCPDTLGLAQGPGQTVVCALGPRLERALREALARHGGADPERLRRALEDRIYGGETDVEVAQRHGLRREPLNRARRHLQRTLEDGFAD